MTAKTIGATWLSGGRMLVMREVVEGIADGMGGVTVGRVAAVGRLTPFIR